MNHFITYSLYDEFQENSQKYSKKKIIFMNELHSCPECKGSGSLFTRFPFFKIKKRIEEKPFYEDDTLKCTFCSGIGKVSESQIKKRKHGEKIRKKRKQHQITIFQAAALTGYSVTDLSNFERGIKESPENLYDEFKK
jgi:hypothetical protein